MEVPHAQQISHSSSQTKSITLASGPGWLAGSRGLAGHHSSVFESIILDMFLDNVSTSPGYQGWLEEKLININAWYKLLLCCIY